jgi:AraC-like DNA-binding protein
MKIHQHQILMKEFIYETITHPVDLFHEIQKVNQPTNALQQPVNLQHNSVFELIDLKDDNWAIYCSVCYAESVKHIMQTNYDKNWMRLMFIKNQNYDVDLDIELYPARLPQKSNSKNRGFESYKSETWIQQEGRVKMMFVFLNEHFLKKELWYVEWSKILHTMLRSKMDEVQEMIHNICKNIGINKLDESEDRFMALADKHKVSIIQKLVNGSLAIIFPNENERVSEKVNIEISGIMQAEQKLMEDFSNDAITLDELAKIAGVNRVKFQELFKKVYGNSFYVYYQKGRFDYAKKLISEQNYSLSEAAYAVGFKNLTHFSRQFEKLIGIKPIQLKSRNTHLY